MQDGLEEGGGRRPAPPTLLVDMKGATTLVGAGVEVDDGFDVGLLGGGAKRVEQIPMYARRLDPHFAADAVQFALAQKMILVLLEKGQHIVPAPAAQPELAPVIVVRGLAAHVDHRVGSRSAADRPAARI